MFQTCSPPGLVLSLSPGLGSISDGVPSPGAAFYRPSSRTSPLFRPSSRTSPPSRHGTSSPCNDLLMAMTNSPGEIVWTLWEKTEQRPPQTKKFFSKLFVSFWRVLPDGSFLHFFQKKILQSDLFPISLWQQRPAKDCGFESAIYLSLMMFWLKKSLHVVITHWFTMIYSWNVPCCESKFCLSVAPLSVTHWHMIKLCFFRFVLNRRQFVVTHPAQLWHRVHQERPRGPGHQETQTLRVKSGDAGAAGSSCLPTSAHLSTWPSSLPVQQPWLSSPWTWTLHPETEEPEHQTVEQWETDTATPPHQVTPAAEEVDIMILILNWALCSHQHQQINIHLGLKTKLYVENAYKMTPLQFSVHQFHDDPSDTKETGEQNQDSR